MHCSQNTVLLLVLPSMVVISMLRRCKPVSQSTVVMAQFCRLGARDYQLCELIICGYLWVNPSKSYASSPCTGCGARPLPPHQRRRSSGPHGALGWKVHPAGGLGLPRCRPCWQRSACCAPAGARIAKTARPPAACQQLDLSMNALIRWPETQEGELYENTALFEVSHKLAPAGEFRPSLLFVVWIALLLDAICDVR